MPKRPDDQKEEQIIRAAETLFAKYGFRKTTVEDIARAAGIAKGTVYLYFENKKQILIRIALEQIIESHLRLERSLEAATESASSKLERIVLQHAESIYRFAERFPDVIEMMPTLEQDELLREGGGQLIDIQHRMLVHALEEGIAAKEFALEGIPTFADHICFMSRAFEPPYKVDSWETLSLQVVQFTDTLIRSIRPSR